MQLKVPHELKEFVESLSAYEPVEEELLVKQALRYGLQDLRREYAIKLFAEGKLSISEGAKLADLSVGEYLDLLTSRGVKSKVTLEDYQQGLKNARALFK